MNKYQSCIDACLRCATVCNHCASSCTKEEMIKMMAHCIQLDMECAAICYTAGQLIGLNSEKSMDICRICADIYEACGEECGRHDTEHCQRCAKVCQEWPQNVGNGCVKATGSTHVTELR